MAKDGIGFGERVPDLGRRDPTGAERFLYDQIGGREALLWVAGDAGAATLALVAQALERSAPRPALALVPMAPAALAATGLPTTDDRAALADDGRACAWLRGTASAKHPLTLLALDPNQRVVLRADLDGATLDSSLAAAGAALARPAWTSTGVVTSGAPALLIPRVFEDQLCDELVALFEADGGVASEVFELVDGEQRWRSDPRYKARRDYQRFDEAWNSRFAEIIKARVLPEVDKCFAFRASGYEAFKLARYTAGEGGYHRPHRDNISADVSGRRFAMSINLNSGDYQGGQLRFPEYGPELYQPPKGGAVVFSSSLLHEALPVTQGKRYVFLTFFESDAHRGSHLYFVPR